MVVTNLFPPGFLGGYELGCAQMVTALRHLGHEVYVVSTPSSAASTGDDEEVSRTLQLAPIYNRPRFDLTPPDVRQHLHVASATVAPGNTEAIATLMEEYKPDVVYLWNLLGLGGLGILALLRHRGVPWVWHVMDMIPLQLCSVGGAAVPELARLFGTIARGHYIMCSSHIAAEIRHGEVDVGNAVHLVPNWITGERSRSRTHFFSGGDLRVMTAVGVLGEHKGTDILIETAARLHDRGYANFTIDIYGREEDPRFRALLYDRDVAGTVRLMGSRAQADLLSLYADYDIFAFPTWTREPFGFAPLEAAGAGCVPLFSADCGIAEWLVDSVHCIKADRTPESFADRIAQVLNGELNVRAIGRRTQTVVRADFHIDVVAARVEAILDIAAAGRCGARRGAKTFHALARFADGLVPVLVAEANL